MSPQDVTERIDHDFNRYYRRYFAGEPFDSYINNAQAVIDATGWQGRILDVGCGFGVFDICLRASGLRSVVGTDVAPEKVSGATRLAELLGIENLEFTVSSAEQLPFADRVFDGVLMKDTVSHLPANTSCYAEVFRVLKPQGSLLIVDDRNNLNPWTSWRTKKLWDRSEFGNPEQAARLGMRNNFSELRLRYIKENFPELSDQACRTLAIETRGLLNRQIGEFIRARDRGARLPRKYAQCVHPESAIVQERLLNPFRLSSQLARVGFATRVLPPLVWRAQSTPLSRLRRVLWPISAVSTAHFRILATRP